MITNEPIRRTTLLIRERLWRAAKIHAFQEGKDLQDVVSEALETYLHGKNAFPSEPAGTNGAPHLGKPSIKRTGGSDTKSRTTRKKNEGGQ